MNKTKGCLIANFATVPYSFTLAELVTKGHLRPLKEASEAENVA
ncbi:transposase [Escherichia coli AD30]|nr:transposase [Escherichia coli AD30]